MSVVMTEDLFIRAGWLAGFVMTYIHIHTCTWSMDIHIHTCTWSMDSLQVGYPVYVIKALHSSYLSHTLTHIHTHSHIHAHTHIRTYTYLYLVHKLPARGVSLQSISYSLFIVATSEGSTAIRVERMSRTSSFCRPPKPLGISEMGLCCSHSSCRLDKETISPGSCVMEL